MRVTAINLPRSERFPCSKRDVRQSLTSTGLASVEFRHTLMRTYRYAHLSFAGPVLAIAGVARARDLSWFYVFPISRAQYPDSAADDFRDSVLPRVRGWLQTEFAKPDTAVLGTQELFVLWADGAHVMKRVSFQ